MSKRFGRNQKRRLKSELANASREIQRLQRTTQDADNMLEALRDKLPQFTTLLKAQGFAVNGDIPDTWRVNTQSVMAPYDKQSIYSVVEMLVFQCRLDLEPLRNGVHVVLSSRDGRGAAYACSRSELRNMTKPQREIIAKLICDTLERGVTCRD